MVIDILDPISRVTLALACRQTRDAVKAWGSWRPEPELPRAVSRRDKRLRPAALKRLTTTVFPSSAFLGVEAKQNLALQNMVQKFVRRKGRRLLEDIKPGDKRGMLRLDVSSIDNANLLPKYNFLHFCCFVRTDWQLFATSPARGRYGPLGCATTLPQIMLFVWKVAQFPYLFIIDDPRREPRKCLCCAAYIDVRYRSSSYGWQEPYRFCEDNLTCGYWPNCAQQKLMHPASVWARITSGEYPEDVLEAAKMYWTAQANMEFGTLRMRNMDRLQIHDDLQPYKHLDGHMKTMFPEEDGKRLVKKVKL